MKKRVFGQKFSRDRGARAALLFSLVREFVLHGELTTTVPRTKFVKPVIDSLVTDAKRNTLEGRRKVFAFLRQDEEAYNRLLEAGQRFKSLNSGFTTIIKLGPRRGDAAPMAKISWVGSREVKDEKK